MKKDVRYVSISLLVHILAIFTLLGGCQGGGNGGSGKEQGGGSNKHGEILDKQLKNNIVEVDLVPGPKKRAPKVKKVVKKQSDSGYYGIGINTLVDSNGFMPVLYGGVLYHGLIITHVSIGNPAHMAGLQENDVIFLVDGKPIDLDEGNRIIGNGPDDVQLGIGRGGQVFFLTVQRAWIETKKEK